MSPATITTKLAALSKQAKAYRQLDIANKVDVPTSKAERLAIWDNLPPELREAFADACEAADKIGGR
jgi:hypothetical protein